MMKLALVLSVLFLANLASAQMAGKVSIERIMPEQGTVGQKLWILFSLENTGPSPVNVSLTEMLGDVEFNESEATAVETLYNKTYWFYEWEISLDAYENASVRYWIIPKYPGAYPISPAEVILNNISVYDLRESEITVRCNANSLCEAGETYLNCPEDCPTGSSDGICDGAKDGVCDLDCTPESDSDCTLSQNGTSQTPQDLLLPALAVLAVAGVAGIVLKLSGKSSKRPKKR
jgi:hypothetical protein